jgi:hypothetical protein
MGTLTKFVLVSMLALFAFLAFKPGVHEAQAISPSEAAMLGQTLNGLPPATHAANTSVNCPTANRWNPDAGTGLIAFPTSAGLNKYATVNVESESTNSIHLNWREGTTQANYATVGRKRCVGCNNGAAYQAEVTEGMRELYCISDASTDAGVIVSVEIAR